MKIIGIVGTTGAGKTTALKELEAFHAEILDCDAIYHQLLTTSEELRERITTRFGSVFDENGLDRKKLGAVVFGDSAALADLNEITYDIITRELRWRIRQAERRGCPVAAIDGVGILDSAIREDCDALVAITAPEEVRLGRIMAREGISEEYARKRIASQPSDEWFAAQCDHRLVNDCEEEIYRQRARDLFRSLI